MLKSLHKYSLEEIAYLKEELKTLQLSSINLNDSLVLDLITAFTKSIQDLRMDVENSTPLLLDKIYGELYGNRGVYPMKIILEITPDPYLSRAVTFEKNTKISVKDVFFSFLEEVTIWPVAIDSVILIDSYNFNDIEMGLKTNTTHLLKVVIKSLNLPLRAMNLSSLRFFIEGDDKLITTLFMKNSSFDIFYMDSQVRNDSNKVNKKCKIYYDIPNVSDDLEILKDFSNLPQLYNFFTIDGFDLTYIFNNLIFYIPLNIYHNTWDIQLKLFNFIGKNIMEGMSQPLTINLQELEQPIIANSYNSSIKILQIKNLILLQTKEVLQNWHSYISNDTTYVSLLECPNIMNLNGHKIYGEIILHNGVSANNLKTEDKVNIINYGNFNGFINHRDYYIDLPLSYEVLQTYLNTDFKLLLNNIEDFIQHMNGLFPLLMPNYNVLINKATLVKSVEIHNWCNIPTPIPVSRLNIQLTTNRDEVWLFLNVLCKFINRLSFTNEKVIISTTWKGKNYVVR